MVVAQGGDPAVVDEPAGLPLAPDTDVVRAPTAGRMAYDDVRAVGRALIELGGGRRALGDPVDPGVGIEIVARAGAPVNAGDELFLVRHRGGRGLEAARSELLRSVALDSDAELMPLVRDA